LPPHVWEKVKTEFDLDFAIRGKTPTSAMHLELCYTEHEAWGHIGAMLRSIIPGTDVGKR
jgi:hypothetical protein